MLRSKMDRRRFALGGAASLDGLGLPLRFARIVPRCIFFDERCIQRRALRRSGRAGDI